MRVMHHRTQLMPWEWEWEWEEGMQVKRKIYKKLMRSSAVGIVNQKNGFVNLSTFLFVFELFQTVYRLRPAPSMAGGGLGPRGRRVGHNVSESSVSQRVMLDGDSIDRQHVSVMVVRQW
jgi:hypothetical protein